ncbi:NAP1-related protein 1-like [Trifolium pratense]|uniref:NAP1-related protein 1-like n=1 Tax=Trifolium pratense TaxID=57577 RepID=UPI001E6971AC|nr:NAP1-related protein 1-like [Trifolium pratense]
MTHQDVQIMKHLTSLEVDEEDLDYSFTFNFSTNPYFEDKTIKKSYKVKHGEMEWESTKINWKADKVMLQEVSHRKKGNTRKTDASVYSFFNWFDTSGPKHYDFDGVKMIIKDYIWPNPLKFFNGGEPFKQAEVWNLQYSDDDDEDNKAFQRMYDEDVKASEPEENDHTDEDDKASDMEDSEEDSDDDKASDMVDMKILYGIQEHLKEIDDMETCSIEEEKKILSRDMQNLYFERNHHIALIPNFWLTVFQKHPSFADLINDEDTKILEHLTSIEVGDPHDLNREYVIVFTFKSNPYLKTTELRKRLTSAGSTIATYQIDWHAGSGSNVRFFNWFQDPNTIDNAATNQVARIIKYVLWPDPLKYYCQ